MSRFSIEATFTAIDKMTAPVTQMEKATRSLSTGIRADFAMMKSSFGNFKNSIFGNLMAYDLFKQAVFAAGKALKYTVDEAMKIEDARAAFTPLVGGAEKAAQLVDMINIAAAETPYRFEAVGKTVKQLLPVMNGDLNKTIDTFKMLGDTAGGNAEKLDSITRGFTKAMLKGRVDMESLNMIAEAGVPIFSELATSMGYNKNEMTAFFKQISTGTVSTDNLINVFKKMTSEGGIFFQGMIIASKTTSGVFSTMQDSISMTAAGIGDALLPVVKEIAIDITRIATEVLQWVQANKELIKTNVRSWFETFKTGVGYIVDVVKFLYDMRGVIKTLIELWIIYKGIQLAAFAFETAMKAWQAAMKLNIFLTNSQTFALIRGLAIWALQTVAMYGMASAIVVVSGAMKVLNLILSLNPIGLIIIAIGLLAYAIYDLYTNWDTYALSFNIKIQDMVTGFYRAKLAVMDLMNAIGLVSDKELAMTKFDYLKSFTEGNKLKLEYLQKGNSVFKQGSEFDVLKNLEKNKPEKIDLKGIDFKTEKNKDFDFLKNIQKEFMFPVQEKQQPQRRDVKTQSQQVASAINSSKNITTNRNTTTQQNMNLVIQNMNPGLIGIQSYYSGI